MFYQYKSPSHSVDPRSATRSQCLYVQCCSNVCGSQQLNVSGLPSTRFILLYTSLLAGVGEYRTSLYIVKTRCLSDRYVSSPLFSLGYWSVLDKYTYINILTVYMFFKFPFYFNYYPLQLKVTLMNVREINSKKIPSAMYLKKIASYQDLTCFVIFSSTVSL